MSFRVRPARPDDYGDIYKMAKLTGGGFTNLPPDKPTLVAKLERSAKSFERQDDEQRGDLYMFVLEDPERKKIRGTCQVFGQVGIEQPFYSYHLSTLTQSSPDLPQPDVDADDRPGRLVGGRRPVPSSRMPCRRARSIALQKPVPVHETASRPFGRAHSGGASRSDG